MDLKDRVRKAEWYMLDYKFEEADKMVEPFLRIESASGWLKRARQALMLSGETIAQRLGVSRSNYFKLETNEARINIATLKKAAEAMDCELVYALRPKERTQFSERVWAKIHQGGEVNIWHVRLNMYYPSKRRALGFRRNGRGMDPDVRQHANGNRHGDTNVVRNISFPSPKKRGSLRPMIKILATWFGCGLSPKAPGTIGSLGSLPLVLALAIFLPPMSYMLATVIFTVGAIFVAQLYEAQTGRHDDKEVVIDEVAGMLVTMAWVPVTWTYIVVGFALFRFFDVLKPFPIGWVDKKIEGGVGCVADDLIAGILSNIILQVILQQGWLA